MPENPSAQPLEMQVNPHKWTTKVNIMVVVAVVVILLIGASYAFYAAQNPGEVQDDVQEDVTPPAGR